MKSTRSDQWPFYHLKCSGHRVYGSLKDNYMDLSCINLLLGLLTAYLILCMYRNQVHSFR